MSAYDNPTIIKDDSAMAWAQATSGFAPSFTQSFDIARKEREAKEKEAKQEAEKNAKEAREQALNNQAFQSKLDYNLQAKTAAIDENLAKAGVSQSGTDLVHGYVNATSTIVGDIDQKNFGEVLTKEARDKGSLYKTQQAEGEANLVNTSGAMYSNLGALKTGEINGTNIDGIRFNGLTSTDQVLSRITGFALAYEDPLKTTKNLIYDAKGDPSKIDFEVNTKVGAQDDLRKIYLETNPALKMSTPEETNKVIDEEIQKGVDNGDITLSKGGEYTLNFKRKIGKDWDGTFYSKIPKINIGTTSIKTGIYANENEKDVSDSYMPVTEYVDVAGNAALDNRYGTAKYQRTLVDMPAIEAAMRPSLEAVAAGMVATDLSNPNIANGLLANLGFGTNYPAEAFSNLTTPEKVKQLADKLQEKEIANIKKKSELTLINGKYYKMSPKDLQIFGDLNKKESSAGGLTANQQAKMAQLAAKEAKERAKLSDTRSTRPVEAGNGKTRIAWSGKNWVKQDKASGGWVEDIDSPPIRSKTEAGKAYLGL
jgi:hypothetical protein